ncbi:uncharacterized protein LOC123678489 isoform X2 [Harmonia axyridis]|uniref:uncharacterized protein LOC123678489 isoform X2 n=1 Tax=Harmonia axyridis TaxID=115357 RepID=UPI001E2774BD|nr:uncharacterized protein LOC123678489 isoform X2 [Harmonia axyridis]
MESQSFKVTFEKEIKGKMRKCWVELIPDDQKEKAVEIFKKIFAADEPLCKTTKMIEDKESMEYFTRFLWYAINQNCTLACFVELEDGQNEMVAVNICYRNTTVKEMVQRAEFQEVPEGINKILETLMYLNKLKDISQEMNVTEYLTSIGLVVIPEYRGYNLGLQVLASRKMLCEKLGLKASLTTFTSPASQRLAEKGGFKDIVSLTYDELEKMRPASKFPDINKYSKRIRNMYILYE